MQKVLMIAFHYPPFQGGSGVHRALKFSRYLPQHGWLPIVISANPRAYQRIGTGQLAEVPSEVIIKRPFAIDTARHLSIKGRYLRPMALPDQWASWWWPAVLAGLKVVRQYHPSIIWSTYPIATAHLIGLTLHRLTRIPWVADFRDSMTEQNYPRDKWCRKSYVWIEKRVARHAARLIFTAPSTVKMYCQRYPLLGPERCVLIPNGYDDHDFRAIETGSIKLSRNGRPLRLLHAGVIYTDDRDPRAFFAALSRLKKESAITGDNLVVDLRASGSEDYYAGLLQELDIGDVVRLLPPLSHRKALEDCAGADGLLLFQAPSCDHQIPAKLYEYLRLGKPIFALTSHAGDTATLLGETGGATVVDLADEQSIYLSLPPFLRQVRDATHPMPDRSIVSRFERRRQAFDLARSLDQLICSSKRT